MTNSWNDINWPKAEQTVFQCQCEIYNASKIGNLTKVHQLQVELLRSSSAKLLALRNVLRNTGSRTGGVDKQTRDSIPNHIRVRYALGLNIDGRANYVRRVWIPKPGTDEKRPLGIPTILDRAKQALVKLALEPQWEALFEAQSLGFRPGRSSQDAIKWLDTSLNKSKGKYVLDADLTKCFDRIDHNYLLDKRNAHPKITKQVRAWLKAGIMDFDTLVDPDRGTPQGGIISPLLANIALHGLQTYLETNIKKAFKRPNIPPNKKGIKAELIPVETLPGKQATFTYVRYADDFVILSQYLVVVLEAKRLCREFFKEIGLEINEKKTRIAHTYYALDRNYKPVEPHPSNRAREDNLTNPGFDFLGFHVRHYGHKTATNERIVLIWPSKKNLKKHLNRITEITNRHQLSQEQLIKRINPVIRGWTRYFRHVNAAAKFQALDNLMYHKLRAWVRGKHTGNTGHTVRHLYWHKHRERNWVFGYFDKEQKFKYIRRYSETRITPYSLVRGEKSPFDGDLEYWQKRTAYSSKNPQLRSVLQQCDGRCGICGNPITIMSQVELDHFLPKAIGGKYSHAKENLQLLHKKCHTLKSAQELPLIMHFKKTGERTPKWQERLDHLKKVYSRKQNLDPDFEPTVYDGQEEDEHT